METQAKVILNALEQKEWHMVYKENPKSSAYWWVWEFRTFEKNHKTFIMTFLIDPQEPKEKESVWAITACAKEPISRIEAEKGLFLGLGAKWEDKLPEFIEKITNTNW